MPDKMPTIKELVDKYLPKEKLEMRLKPKELPIDWSKVLIDWPKVFPLFPRYCHVLLIAPDHGPGDYTHYSIQGADEFFAFANPIVTVKYLRDADATRANVEKELKEFNPRLVVHYDHGNVNCVYGESAANIPQKVIDTSNADRLWLRVMSTISCLSASGLGPTAVGKGCSCYIGYDDLHWIVTTTHKAFWECGEKVHEMLVLGYTTKTGYDAAIECYNNYIAYFSSIGDTFTAAHLVMDRDRLTLVGSEKATTCPFMIHLIQPIYELVKLKQIPELVWPLKVFELEKR